MNEIWQQLINYPNYQISSLGRVKNSEKFITVYKHKRYPQVCLYKENRPNWVQLNKLVASAFVLNPNGFCCVGHSNEDLFDCVADNLFWRKCGPVASLSKEELKNRARNRTLLLRYGIDSEIYQQLLEGQKHCCWICKKHESNFSRRLAVDHVHNGPNKGAVRGLLCWTCNRQVIGNRTDPVLFEKAAEYLRQPLTGWFAPVRKKKRRRKKRKKS